MEKRTIRFTKKQVLDSKKFKTVEKDVLKAILEDKQYSLNEISEILKKFRNKEVS